MPEIREIVKIQDSDGKQTVNARRLHEWLEVGKDFSNWIKDRIEQFDFVENQDFIIDSPKMANQSGRGGDRRSLEYHLSLDMAKELSMVERSEKGKQARLYFIECERRLKERFAIPKTKAEALRLAADLEEKLEAAKPKIEFYDAVTGSTDAIDIGSVAKVLNMGVGRNALFSMLRDDGILMSNNQPYQQYIDNGYFRVIEQKYTKPDGSTHIFLKTVVYQRGVDYIRRLIAKESKEAA